jgi:pyruvate carboxylase subunit B
VRLTDSSLRDGNESLLGCRLRTDEILSTAAKLDRVGFAALEVFGGATFEAWLRLGDHPWSALRRLREVVTGTPLQALVRSQSLLGHRHLADDAVELFFATAAGHGVDVFRVFDPLNDPRNLEVAVRAARRTGKRVQAALCWTPGPAGEAGELTRLAARVAELEPDDLVVTDGSGALDGGAATALVAGIRVATGLPVILHAHGAGGLAMLAYLAAVEAGAEGLDTAVSAVAWGPSLPAAESVVAALAAVGRDPGIDLGRLAEARQELWELRRSHGSREPHGAVDAGAEALRWGLTATVLAELQEELGRHGATGRLEEAVSEVARVHEELGRPPLVSPLSRMVAVQAVYNLLGRERYATVTQELKDYLHGLSGRPPCPPDRGIRRFVLGQDEPITLRPADLLEPQVEGAREELRRRGLPAGDEEALTHLMFPAEAEALLRPAPAEAVEAGAPEAAEEAASEAASAAEAGPAADETAAVEAPAAAPAAQFEVEVGGEVFTVRVTGASVAALPAFIPDRPAPASPPAQPEAPRDGTVVAPMQGLIVKIPISVGDQVQLGDVLVVLEAMKMQNDIVATKPGRVTGIYVKEGEVVKPDQALVAVG